MKYLVALFAFVSVSASASYVCFPSKKNEFATDIMNLSVKKTKVSFFEGSLEGVAKFKGIVSEGVDRFVNFEHAVYDDMRKTKPDVLSPDWFGEGYGQMLVQTSMREGAERGRMAIAWCHHWCNYDYFNCVKKGE